MRAESINVTKLALVPDNAPTNKRPKKKPTIIDVAERSGLSKSLVARALAGRDGVSKSSRERILRAADELGYQRNAWARSLVKGSTQIFGVVATDISSTYRLEVIVGIEDAAASRSYTTILAHGRRDPEVLAQRLDQMMELGVDGMIVVSSRIPTDRLTRAGERMPVVVVGRPDTVPDSVDLIRNDDETGGALATQHLIDLGHTHIGFVASSDRAAIRAREGAWFDTMTAAGLNTDWIARRNGANDLAQVVADRIANESEPPTALVVSTDGLAAAIVGAAVDRGIAVPDELAVVGYNNSALATQIRPALTSVDQPRGQMGATAVEMLFERLGGRTTQRIDVVEPRLVVRGSTQPDAR